MRWLLVIPILLLAAVFSSIFALNSGLFDSTIERTLNERLQAKVSLSTLRLRLVWPPQVTTGEAKIDHELGTLSWRGLSVEMLRLTSPYALRLSLDRPVFEAKATRSKSSPAVTAESSGASAQVSPMHVALRIIEGEFRGPEGKLSGVNLNFEQKLLLKSPASLHLKALVESNSLPFPLPLQLDSDTLTLSSSEISATDLKVGISGLQALAKGTSLLNEDRHRWQASVDAPDLARLPKPPLETAAKGWRGLIRLRAEVVKEGAAKPWSVEGDIKAEKVGAELNFKQQKLSVRGPFELNLSTHFTYFDSRPTISACNGELDLSSAEIVYENLLHKAIGVPLQLKIGADGNQEQLQLREFELKFSNLALRLKGESKLKPPYLGKMYFEIPTVALKGAEKTFLPLASSPVQGELELRGEIEGPLLDPWHSRVKIAVAKLKDISAQADYAQATSFLQVRGPVKVTAELAGEWNSGALKQVQAKGDLGLSGAALGIGPLRKEAGQTFTASFAAKNTGDVLEISKLDLQSFVGVARISGRVKNLLDPTLENLQVNLQPLNLSELRLAVPQYRDLIPKGLLNTELRLNGRRSLDKPWQDWPLKVEGSVRLQLPEYKLAAASSQGLPAAGSKDAAPTAEASAFLPRGFLTENMRVKVLAELNSFSTDTLKLKGVRSDGAVDNGHYRGGVSIQEVFSGSMGLSQLDVPLLDKRPVLKGSVSWQNLVIQDAIGFAKPEFKDFAEGRMAGRAIFASLLPGDKDFLANLKSRGSLVMQPVTLNTVKFGDMLNEMIEKVPEVLRKQAKLQSVKAEPLKGLIKTDFNLQSQAMNIESFVAKDLDGSELSLKGKVLLKSLQGDLVGQFLWSKPQIQGCLLEGNSDAQGRMLIPVAIKGDLMHPGFSMLSDLLNKLGGKALQCEQKKLNKSLEQEGKKLLKGLFGK